MSQPRDSASKTAIRGSLLMAIAAAVLAVSLRWDAPTLAPGPTGGMPFNLARKPPQRPVDTPFARWLDSNFGRQVGSTAEFLKGAQATLAVPASGPVEPSVAARHATVFSPEQGPVELQLLTSHELMPARFRGFRIQGEGFSESEGLRSPKRLGLSSTGSYSLKVDDWDDEYPTIKLTRKSLAEGAAVLEFRVAQGSKAGTVQVQARVLPWLPSPSYGRLWASYQDPAMSGFTADGTVHPWTPEESFLLDDPHMFTGLILVGDSEVVHRVRAIRRDSNVSIGRHHPSLPVFAAAADKATPVIVQVAGGVPSSLRYHLLVVRSDSPRLAELALWFLGTQWLRTRIEGIPPTIDQTHEAAAWLAGVFGLQLSDEQLRTLPNDDLRAVARILQAQPRRPGKGPTR